MIDVAKPQADKFRDMARDLERDEGEAAFDDKVRKMPTAGPGQSPEPAKG